jgi:hypothetical protein
MAETSPSPANLQAEPEFYRPSERDRAARARQWLAVARGESPDPQEGVE